jgi:spore coat protein CotH
VGIRLKGGGSYRHLEGKPAFKVDLNEYVSGQRLRGLKGLTFNNANQDPTTTHEYITYGLFRAAGVPAARIGFANLWLNDELYGLYVHFEDFDDLFLEQWFDRHEEVHLWEGAKNDWSEIRSPTSYEYEEGPGEDKALMDEISGDFFVDPLDETAMDTWSAGVDMDAFLAMNAMDALTMNNDGYQHVHNFYVYRTADALWGWTSTGADYSWDGSDYYGPYGGEGTHFGWFLQNAEWEAAYNQALRDAADLAENSDLPGLFDELIEFLDPHFTADPRKEHTIAEIAQGREETRNYLETRPAELLAIVAAREKK